MNAVNSALIWQGHCHKTTAFRVTDAPSKKLERGYALIAEKTCKRCGGPHEPRYCPLATGIAASLSGVAAAHYHGTIGGSNSLSRVDSAPASTIGSSVRMTAPAGSHLKKSTIHNVGTARHEVKDEWVAHPTWNPAPPPSRGHTPGPHEDWRGSNMPLRGERVQFTNMRKREELNGSVAEVLSNSADDAGFLVVRVFDKNSDEDAKGKRMKVHPCRLIPVPSAHHVPMNGHIATLNFNYPRSHPASVMREGGDHDPMDVQSCFTLASNASSRKAHSTSSRTVGGFGGGHRRPITPLVRA